MTTAYRTDAFLHFDSLACCAVHVKDRIPEGEFDAIYAQVYSKIKVPFYNYIYN